jgi:hypothetical protein
MFKLTSTTLALLLASTQSYADVVFTDTFSNLTIGSSDTFSPGWNTCASHGGSLYVPDPEDVSWSIGAGSSKWTFFPSGYPDSWAGTGCAAPRNLTA